MKTLLRITVTCLVLLQATPVEALFSPTGSHEGSLTPRGFRRSLSRSRDLSNYHCFDIEDATLRKQCFVQYKSQRRSHPLSVDFAEQEMQRQKTMQRCGHLVNVAEWRACGRGHIADTKTSQGQRVFNKRTRRKKSKEVLEACKEFLNPHERLRCLQRQGTKRTSKVKLNRRTRLQQNAPVRFISPSGLRRNLSRASDLTQSLCGNILDGDEKRACIKDAKRMYQGY